VTVGCAAGCIGALVGAVIGAIVGWATYGPDPSDLVGSRVKGAIIDVALQAAAW
jgi:hypothetical protein